MSLARLLRPAAVGQRPQSRLRGCPCPLHVCAAAARPLHVCASSSDAQWLSSFGRVLKEKAQADLGRVFGASTAKTREKLGVVNELLAYWKLDEADDVLEELEEALIVSGARWQGGSRRRTC